MCLPLLLAMVTGCQARRLVNNYLGFDAAVSDLYEKHVLYNLARCDEGATMIQMKFTGFSANISNSLGTSGQVAFFTNPKNNNGTTSVSLNAFQQAFQPTVNNSTAQGLSINSAPAENQNGIRALYEAQVKRPEESKFYCRTWNRLAAMCSSCYVRFNDREYYYVPDDMREEFTQFVYSVAFYKPDPNQPSPASKVVANEPLSTPKPAAGDPAPASRPAASQPIFKR